MFNFGLFYFSLLIFLFFLINKWRYFIFYSLFLFIFAPKNKKKAPI